MTSSIGDQLRVCRNRRRGWRTQPDYARSIAKPQTAGAAVPLAHAGDFTACHFARFSSGAYLSMRLVISGVSVRRSSIEGVVGGKTKDRVQYFVGGQDGRLESGENQQPDHDPDRTSADLQCQGAAGEELPPVSACGLRHRLRSTARSTAGMADSLSAPGRDDNKTGRLLFGGWTARSASSQPESDRSRRDFSGAQRRCQDFSVSSGPSVRKPSSTASQAEVPGRYSCAMNRLSDAERLDVGENDCPFLVHDEASGHIITDVGSNGR